MKQNRRKKKEKKGKKESKIKLLERAELIGKSKAEVIYSRQAHFFT